MMGKIKHNIQVTTLLFGIASMLFASPSSAQEVDLDSVQTNLAIFSGILEESLSLKESTGLFGMSLGGVQATYLHGQGALLEIRSPLSSRRNRMGLASLSSTMQALQLRQNPFDIIRQRAANNSTSISAPVENEPSESSYSQLLDRITNVDFSLVAQSAIQQANQSARALRALGEMDEQDFSSLEAEIGQLRESVEANYRALRELEQEIRQTRAASVDSAEDSLEQVFDSQLNNLLAGFETMKQQAVAKAEELRARSERAEAEYAAAWEQDFQEFSEALYASICEYGNTLRALPETQNISLILKDLGQQRDDNSRSDLIHVLAVADVRACSNGSMDVASLRQQATIYSY